MNPLKNLFSKVFETAPAAAAKPDASKENGAFEWNPEEETVAATSAQGVSWKRGDTPDEAPTRAPGEATPTELGASAHSLPTPTFEKPSTPAPSPETVPLATRPFWNEPAVARTLASEPNPAAPSSSIAAPRVESAPGMRASTPEVPMPSLPASAGVANPVIALSDFEDVYRKAGIKSPGHGYGVERVYRLLTSRRLTGLDRTIRRSALLTALDAAGVPPSDVSQDAVLRRKALTAYEAEKALELQSLRSRNESRAEALQETVETFTRQKQSQIERLAQGSTAAVRAQSDLEIRKRMEQDRLYRSLAYFVEPMPTPSAYPPPRLERPPVAEIRPSSFEATVQVTTIDVTPERSVDTVVRTADLGAPPPEVKQVTPFEPAIVRPEPSVAVGSASDTNVETRPLSQSGLEMALRAAAQEAKNAGWGQTAIVEDGATDTVDALRKLREAQKTDSES